jgi:outer membrane biosynthesis protein TonB
VNPVLPANFRAMLRGPANVSLRVFIDGKGNVTRVEPAGARESIPPLALGAAVSAAKAWKFEPAQMRGRPVPSEFEVTFQFTGSR